MFNLSPRVMLLGSVFVTAVIAAALIIFAVFPLMNGVSLISADIQNKKTAVATLAERREQKAELRESYESIKQDVALVNSQFIDRDSLVVFIQDAETVAAQAGVSLKISSAGPAQPARKKESGALFQEKFLLTLSGDFAGLMRFLGAFENSRYFNKVDNILMRKLENYQLSQNSGLSEGNVEGLITVQVFTR